MQDTLQEHVHKHEIVFEVSQIGQKIITLFFIKIRDGPIFDIKMTKYVLKNYYGNKRIIMGISMKLFLRSLLWDRKALPKGIVQT